jgi:putative ABC transport system permease protein
MRRGIVRQWWLRLIGTFRAGRSDDDLEEELRLHAALAEDPSSGALDRALEALRDQRGLPGLDALKSDIIFGWRQIRRHAAVSIVSVVSLGLAVGATASAFRIMDAVLLRPLPVTDPDRLSFLQLSYIDSQGEPDTREDFDYPTYRAYQQILKDTADVMVVGMSNPVEATVGSDHDSERVLRQYVSGNMFGTLGLEPALGRLIAPADDNAPGAHPVMVLSFDYWTRRFHQDPRAVGSTIHLGDQLYDVIGVAPASFIGTEPGLVPDVFVPATMNTEALNANGWSWFTIWVRPKAGAEPEHVRQVLQADFDREQQARLKGFSTDTPRATIERFLAQRIFLRPAGHGVSPIQKHLGTPLLILTAIVALVLMMACATVGNLLTSLAIARAKEMALRVSIGAGRGRLVQMMFVESAMLALAAFGVGALVAWWAPPAVMAMIEPIEIPIRLVFDLDWRLVALLGSIAILVTGLFGFAPALRASSVAPVTALKGGDVVRSRRAVKSLLVVQMIFCAFVLFAAGLFRTTFVRLSSQSFGFSYDRVLCLAADSRAEGRILRLTELRNAVARLPGVESAAVAGWPLLSDNGWNVTIHAGGRVADTQPAHALGVLPGFFKTLHIGMIEGRDFRSGDAAPSLDAANHPVAGVGIVNQAFARYYFSGRSPVGRRVAMRQGKDVDAPLDIIGVVADTAYRHVREPMRPIVFVPFTSVGEGVLLVRSAGDPLAMAPTLGRVVRTQWPGARVREIRPAGDFIETQMVVERLLARLTGIFAGLGLLLAAIGLYAVVNDAVIQRRKEIGVRIALGAQSIDVARHVTVGAIVLVGCGLAVGLATGVAFGRMIGALLFQVTPTDPSALVMPLVILASVFGLASLPPVIRAVRTDPVETLRSD